MKWTAKSTQFYLHALVVDTTFISLCDGVSGTIGALTINENYECDFTGSILIDTLMVDLTN
jgi:hypothetical protein